MRVGVSVNSLCAMEAQVRWLFGCALPKWVCACMKDGTSQLACHPLFNLPSYLFHPLFHPPQSGFHPLQFGIHTV